MTFERLLFGTLHLMILLGFPHAPLFPIIEKTKKLFLHTTPLPYDVKFTDWKFR